MNEQFLRNVMIIGEEAQERLFSKHVAVVGVGGVGSYAAEGLARAGVGAITLIDFDVIVKSNINRQLHAMHSTIGEYKTLVMAKRIADINPNCRITPITAAYTSEMEMTGFDYIIDCIDVVTHKLNLIETAHNTKTHILSALGTGNRLNPSALKIGDISETTDCPLARIVRRELRKRCIYNTKVIWNVEPLPKTASENSRVPGSIAWVPGCAGLMMAGEAVRELIR